MPASPSVNARAFIAGCSGPSLTDDERAFFRDARPWGFILFRRNIGDPEQVRALCADLRETIGEAGAPILVDQEGGRVQRLGAPHWPPYPAGGAYLRAGRSDLALACALARSGARLIAHDLAALGISVDCLPVLDVPVPGAHGIIGDRAYSDDPAEVAALGRAAAEGLLQGGVLPVIKHIPGHGRAGADSHEGLPVVHASLEELRVRDFEPFKSLADMPLAMTAHVVFTALDPAHPATTSRTVIETIVRGEIGFDGLLMSDDLSMKALTGSFRGRAEAAIAAGCDVVLHCNGDLDEMRQVADGTPLLAGEAQHRAGAALARIEHGPEPFDVVDARARLDGALAALA